MGGKLLWTGLTIIMTTGLINLPAAVVVGQVLMIIGCVLMWLDK
jgi:hypothetical protein